MTSPRKIKVFILNLYSNVGGGEQLLYHLLKEFDRERFEPVMAFNSDGPFVEMVKALGVETVQLRYPTVMLRRLIRPGEFMEVRNASRELWHYLAEQRPDVIHCSDVLSLLLLGPAAKRLNIPVLYSVIFFHEWSRMMVFNPLALAWVNNIVVNSDMVRNDLLRRTFFLRGRITTVHNGVDVGGFRPRKEGERNRLREEFRIGGDVRLVGMAGRFDPVKGHLLFLRSARKLLERRKDVKFIIAGDVVNDSSNPALGLYKEKVLRHCADLELASDVIFLGRRADIGEVMRSLDLLVVPSVREGFGLVVPEALASGVGVVASPVVGALEILSGVPGVFVVEKRSASSFAGKIHEGLEFMRGHPGDVGLPEEFARRLSWSRCAKEFERCYTELVA